MARKNHTNNDIQIEGDGAINDAVVLDEREGPILHRDLSGITVTDIDGITINRTRRGISPFVPILKTPTFSQNSGTLAGYAVEVEDPDEETGYKHVGNVSKGYLLLSNEEVRDLAVEVAVESGLDFRESRMFWDGARFCHVIDFLGVEEEVAEGDPIGLSLVTRNSYDKSWRFESCLMGRRFVCDNGALSGEFFARVGFKHLGGKGAEGGGENGSDEAGKEETWKHVVREGLSLIDHAPDNLAEFVRGLRLLRGTPMSDQRLREVWRLFPTIGDSIKGQILSRYVEHEEPSLFGFFNAGTNVFWHREKMTAADYAHNDVFTTCLLKHAFEHLN